MSMSGESIRAQALRCACMVAPDFGLKTEKQVIDLAYKWAGWIQQGAFPLGPTGHMGTAPARPLSVPGQAGVQQAASPMRRQMHDPPCAPGHCPNCDAARQQQP